MRSQPSVFPLWTFIVALLGAFAVFVALVYAGYPTPAITLLLVVSLGGLVLMVLDIIVISPRRSATLRARLTPADVAARVDLAALATVVAPGSRDSVKQGVRVVRRSFPRLTAADAIEVIRDTVPTPWPPRPTPERRPV